MNVDLAGRIVAGAHAGSLVLTADEFHTLTTETNPADAVIVNGQPRLIRSLVVHILPNTITTTDRRTP